MSANWNLPPGVTPRDIDNQFADGSEEPLGFAEFLELTKKVRESQKLYFKTRNPVHLSQAKRLEDELDREIELQERGEQ